MLYEYFENLKKEDKLSHSFLVGNVFYDDVKDQLSKITNEILLDSKMNIEENPDVYILKNREKSISKEDIKELLCKVNSTSQFHNGKVYIIENCEKLNDSSCNALLKTLEEPPKNVYAILLTSNMEDVIKTIYSRCQKIFISSNVNNNQELDQDIDVDSIIEIIEQYNIKTISEKIEIYSIINSRDDFVKLLNKMLYIYKECLDKKIKNEEYQSIIMNNNIEEISKKIIVINDNINRLDKPLNKLLSIDRFIIEMWRCKNENN